MGNLYFERNRESFRNLMEIIEPSLDARFSGFSDYWFHENRSSKSLTWGSGWSAWRSVAISMPSGWSFLFRARCSPAFGSPDPLSTWAEVLRRDFQRRSLRISSAAGPFSRPRICRRYKTRSPRFPNSSGKENFPTLVCDSRLSISFESARRRAIKDGTHKARAVHLTFIYRANNYAAQYRRVYEWSCRVCV